jgi:hypothetical protein
LFLNFSACTGAYSNLNSAPQGFKHGKKWILHKKQKNICHTSFILDAGAGVPSGLLQMELVLLLLPLLELCCLLAALHQQHLFLILLPLQFTLLPVSSPAHNRVHKTLAQTVTWLT